jgi:ABC-type transport system substrate-binding protein
MIVRPKAAQEDGKNFASEPCGAGSYQVTSEVSGSSINLKRFSGYYGGTPAYSTVTWTIFSTATAMETAARSGQLDVALQAPAADVSQLRGSSDFSVNVGPSLLYTQVYLDDAEKPFNNVDVRLAFNYAINRTALIEAVNGGPGTPAWQPVSAGNPFYSKTLGATYPYDPARARSLMAKAGDAGGVSFTCVDFPGLNFETAGPILQQEEAAVGIHIKILEESISEALAQSAEGVYPCSFSAWTGRPDPALSCRTSTTATGSTTSARPISGSTASSTKCCPHTGPRPGSPPCRPPSPPPSPRRPTLRWCTRPR